MQPTDINNRVAEGPGYTIDRVPRDRHDSRRVDFVVWLQGQDQPALSVEVWPPYERYGSPAGAQVSWPSTSDKRPALARALGVALGLAADFAEAQAPDA